MKRGFFSDQCDWYVMKWLLIVLAVSFLCHGASAERGGTMYAFFKRFSLAVERGEPESHTLFEESIGAWYYGQEDLPQGECTIMSCLPIGASCQTDDPDSQCRFNSCLFLLTFYLSLSSCCCSVVFSLQKQFVSIK